MTFTSYHCPNIFLSPALENCTAAVHLIPHSPTHWHYSPYLPWLFSGFPDEGVIGHFPISAQAPEQQSHSTAINRPCRNTGVDGKGYEKWTPREWESKPLALSAWKWLFMPHSQRSQLGCDAWHVSSLPHYRQFNYLPCKLARAFISRTQPW